MPLVPAHRLKFFSSTSSAAVSASAFSLRFSSRSSSFTRFSAAASRLRSLAGRGSVAAPERAPAAACCHSFSCASCSPSRRSSAPSSSSAMSWAAASTRSFSWGVHFLGAGGRAGFFSSGGGGMAATLFASRNHCDNVGWDTPTCRASTEALTALGPTIRFTICALNASAYGTASRLLSPPRRGQLSRSAEATSSLTQGGWRGRTVGA